MNPELTLMVVPPEELPAPLTPAESKRYYSGEWIGADPMTSTSGGTE